MLSCPYFKTGLPRQIITMVLTWIVIVLTVQVWHGQSRSNCRPAASKWVDPFYWVKLWGQLIPGLPVGGGMMDFVQDNGNCGCRRAGRGGGAAHAVLHIPPRRRLQGASEARRGDVRNFETSVQSAFTSSSFRQCRRARTPSAGCRACSVYWDHNILLCESCDWESERNVESGFQPHLILMMGDN